MGHVNMPHSYGVRARTRHMFSKKHRQHGPIHLSQYLMSLKVGDYVDIFADSAIHRGMPHKHYHGRTGIIFNVTKAAVGIRVNKFVNGRIIEKRIHVRVEHVRKSKCQKEILPGRLPTRPPRMRHARPVCRSVSNEHPSYPRRDTSYPLLEMTVLLPPSSLFPSVTCCKLNRNNKILLTICKK